MCGICGVKRFTDIPIDRDAIDTLLINNSNRGLEAAGVALQQLDGTILVHKQDCTPLEFVTSHAYKDFMEKNLREDTLAVIGHTRKVTKGTPRKNENNHPMFAGKVAVIHNGSIHNDDQMFNEFKLERRAETDSDIFRAVLDKEGFTRKAINILNKFNGSAAIVALSTEEPGKMLMGRSGNPIQIAATKNHLFFSSETGPLHQAIRPYESVFGVMMRVVRPEAHFMIPMNDDSVWMWGNQPKGDGENWQKDWILWTQELKIAPRNWSPHAYTCHAQYNGNRLKFYDERPVDVAQCPNCKLWIDLPKQMEINKLKLWTCRNCKTKLG